MMGGMVKVVNTTRRVPALKVNSIFPVFVRGGNEFILDEYGGYFPLKQAKNVGIILERLHG